MKYEVTLKRCFRHCSGYIGILIQYPEKSTSKCSFKCILLCSFYGSVNFNALLRFYNMERETEYGKKALNMCLHTLRMIAKGGIHDHIGQVICDQYIFL